MGSADETSGDATLSGATFNSPRGIALYTTGTSSNENLFIYVADYGTGNSANQSGFTNGGGPAATFYGPNSLCFGFSTNVLGGGGTPILFIGDASNHAIRYALGAAGNTAGSQMNFQTVAGTGIPGLVNGTYAQAQFEYPDGVAYNPVDGNLYVIEFGNNDIRKILLH
jgi:hypothetical protein